jgi:2-polyprenyl-3-methyl-5-hydroxy-6-metoxy-1,4-benzoquinol methylase
MENWTCPICGVTQYPNIVAEIVWNTPIPGPSRYKAVQCTNCDVEAAYPMPSKEVLAKYYSDYHPTQILEQTYRANRLVELQDPLLSFLIERLGGLDPHLKFLDYGFGAGAFLMNAAKKGLSATGLDFGRQNIEQLRSISRERNLKIEAYDMEQDGLNALRGNFYDCITMFQVIEHLVSPLDTLAQLRNLQKPGGILYIECPNQAGLFFRIKNLLRPLINRKFMWGSLSPPQHVLGFTKKSLAKLLERAGYEPLEVNDYRVADGLHAPETPYWYPSLWEWLTDRNQRSTYRTAKMLIRLFDYPASHLFSAGGGLYALAKRI